MNAPAPAQIRAQVRAIRDKFPKASVIGIRSTPQWDGEPVLRVGGESFDVLATGSALAIRDTITSRGPDAPPLVLVTDLSDDALGGDVLAVLARQRLYAVEPWEAVKSHYGVTELDSGVVRRRWMAEALLAAVPSEGRAEPLPSGVMDLAAAWSIVLRAALGFTDGAPDLPALLAWTLGEDRRPLLNRLAQELRDELPTLLREHAGPAGPLILGCVDRGHGPLVLPIGLVATVLFDPNLGEAPEAERSAARDAAVRLETLVGVSPIAADVARAWAGAAEVAVRHLLTRDEARGRSVLDAADRLLEELHGGAVAHRSTLLPTGFDARLRTLSAVVGAAVAEAPVALPADLERALLELNRHEAARRRDHRVRVATMAARLLRWLAVVPPRPPATFTEAARRYASEGGFVDWALAELRRGDPASEVASAWAALAAKVRVRRESDNRVAAPLLSAWTPGPPETATVLGIEQVLDAVVAPLAAAAPVLLLIVDGMSMAVFSELLADLVTEGWVERVPESGSRRPAVAALPTVTECSRASLLAGRIGTGLAADEKTSFGQHVGLVRASSGKAPLVFHRADLVSPGPLGLTPAASAALGDATQPIVAVVLNAVDDHLLKGDLLHVDWRIDTIRPLRQVLAAAQDAGRAIVVTSDHGHVIEHETTLRTAGDGERWRAALGEVAADEVLLDGPRVASAFGGKIIAPWSEAVRFGAKRNGYHGGASLQEAVVTVTVLAPSDVKLSGWVEVAMEQPAWWRAPEEAPVVVPPPPPSASALPKRPPAARQQGHLWERSSEAADPSWLVALLNSALYAERRAVAGRMALPDNHVRGALLALNARGGTLTRASLAATLDLPPIRVNGIVAALRRLLNVDGYPVLTVDEAGDTISLNRELLAVQFELNS